MKIYHQNTKKVNLIKKFSKLRCSLC